MCGAEFRPQRYTTAVLYFCEYVMESGEWSVSAVSRDSVYVLCVVVVGRSEDGRWDHVFFSAVALSLISTPSPTLCLFSPFCGCFLYFFQITNR